MLLFQDIPDGVKLRGRDFTKITQAHNTDRIISVQGGAVFPGSNGASLVIPRQKNTRVIRVNSPWFLTGQIESGVAKIGIKPGMVNNLVPTIGGTSLVAVPPPTITVTGASGIIQLKATVDGVGAITALIAENVAGPTVTADTTTLKYKLIGTWTSDAGQFTSVNSILNTNQTLYLCNGTAIWEA
jgi:hypothetical protein